MTRPRLPSQATLENAFLVSLVRVSLTIQLAPLCYGT